MRASAWPFPLAPASFSRMALLRSSTPRCVACERRAAPFECASCAAPFCADKSCAAARAAHAASMPCGALRDVYYMRAMQKTIPTELGAEVQPNMLRWHVPVFDKYDFRTRVIPILSPDVVLPKYGMPGLNFDAANPDLQRTVVASGAPVAVVCVAAPVILLLCVVKFQLEKDKADPRATLIRSIRVPTRMGVVAVSPDGSRVAVAVNLSSSINDPVRINIYATRNERYDSMDVLVEETAPDATLEIATDGNNVLLLATSLAFFDGYLVDASKPARRREGLCALVTRQDGNGSSTRLFAWNADDWTPRHAVGASGLANVEWRGSEPHRTIQISGESTVTEAPDRDGVYLTFPSPNEVAREPVVYLVDFGGDGIMFKGADATRKRTIATLPSYARSHIHAGAAPAQHHVQLALQRGLRDELLCIMQRWLYVESATRAVRRTGYQEDSHTVEKKNHHYVVRGEDDVLDSMVSELDLSGYMLIESETSPPPPWWSRLAFVTVGRKRFGFVASVAVATRVAAHYKGNPVEHQVLTIAITSELEAGPREGAPQLGLYPDEEFYDAEDDGEGEEFYDAGDDEA